MRRRRKRERQRVKATTSSLVLRTHVAGEQTVPAALGEDTSEEYAVALTSSPPVSAEVSAQNLAQTDVSLAQVSTGSDEVAKETEIAKLDESRTVTSSDEGLEGEPRPDQYTPTWPALVDKHIPSQLRNILSPLVLMLILWLLVVAWMTVQDNSSHLLDSLAGLARLSAKAAWFLIACLFLCIAFVLSRKDWGWRSRVGWTGVVILGIVVLLFAVLGLSSVSRSTPAGIPDMTIGDTAELAPKSARENSVKLGAARGTDDSP